MTGDVKMTGTEGGYFVQPTIEQTQDDNFGLLDSWVVRLKMLRAALFDNEFNSLGVEITELINEIRGVRDKIE